MIFIYVKDKYEKEPLKLLILAFILGIFSTIPAIIIGKILEAFNFTLGINPTRTILFAFLGVGFVEEFSKFIFIRWFIYKNKNFNEPMDGVVYSVMLSMGFAALENIIYVFTSEAPTYTAIVRSLTAVPAHTTFAVIMGLYIGLARFSPRRKRFKYLITGLLAASIAHGIYDVFLFLDCTYCLFYTLIALVVFIRISLKIISRFQKISPFKR